MHRTDIQGPTAAQRQQHERLHGNFINTSTAIADHLFSTLRRCVFCLVPKGGQTYEIFSNAVSTDETDVEELTFSAKELYS